MVRFAAPRDDAGFWRSASSVLAVAALALLVAALVRRPPPDFSTLVSGHAHTLLGPSVELVEEMGIHACPSRDDEEAGAGLAFKIETLYLAQRDPARRGMQGCPRRRRDIHWQAEVVGESVGRAHGQNRESSAGIRQHLNNVVNGAIAAAGKDGVETRKDDLPRLLLRLGTGVGEDEWASTFAPRRSANADSNSDWRRLLPPPESGL